MPYCHRAQGGSSQEAPHLCGHQRNNKTCTIGESANPGPGVNNKQLRQTKMGDFNGGVHHLRDEKAEWCREKGLVIHRARGDGNCVLHLSGQK
eukprot:10706883-Heterocapsa_arctica.AAC.1